MTRILVVGGGGREHAIAWACARDRDVELVVAPGNGGTADIAENVALDPTDAASLARLATERGADLVVIGPDGAAAAGVADACAAAGVAVFGPTASAARIESSKCFAKALMRDAGIATARWVAGDAAGRARLEAFIADAGGACVVKADGLALGKGVFVCDDAGDARRALDACFEERRFGSAGARVVVEERLSGPELSVLALSDGANLRVLTPARDHKRAGDGDEGPNTGGMGAVAPPDGVTPDLVRQVADSLMQPCIDALRERGAPFTGCLYAGIMLTAAGPLVLEFNARFGDPEAQVLLPLLDESLVDVMTAAVRGALAPGVAATRAGHATGVVLAASGYPGEVRRGDVIHGTEAIGDGVLCFHAGTRRDVDGVLRTAGGRVLTIAATGDTLEASRRAAYAGVARVDFEGMWFRHDIGAAGAAVGAAR